MLDRQYAVVEEKLNPELWMQISAGSEQAYTTIYRFLYKRFYNYGRKFTHDQALIQDAIQEALILIWEKKNALKDITYPSSYFYNSFRYILFEKIKTAQKLVEPIHGSDTPEFHIEEIKIADEIDAALKSKMQMALQQLTSRQREVIFLRFFESLSYDEVAATMGITTKATYKIVARTLAKLKENMSISSVLAFYLLQCIHPSGIK